MRRRFAYTIGGRPLAEPIEVTSDFQSTADRQPLFTDRHHEGNRAPDGTDIGSRARRAAWMKATGVADASDYSQHWQRAQEQREAWRSGRSAVSQDTITEVGRAAHEARQRGRR